MISLLISTFTIFGILISPVQAKAAQIPTELPVTKTVIKTAPSKSNATVATAPKVPFYSQFEDITSPTWKKVGCGVASLAMLIDYYKPAVSVDSLLKQGIASGAYLQNAGWTYKGLIALGEKYGLEGSSHDLAGLSLDSAFKKLKGYLKDGPVMVSIHYKFDPKSTIPHLVVINGIVDDVIYYNDPAEKTGAGQISTDKFLKAWKKRFIVIRPSTKDSKITSKK